MFDIMKIQPVLNYLQQISPNRYDIKPKNIIIHCPYCGDNSPKHGHLYISRDFPIFHCFRCSVSGTLTRLLIETGFDDEEIIKYLSQFIKYKFSKDYYNIKKRKEVKLSEIQKHIIQINLEFEKTNKNAFDEYKNYIISRIGNIDFSKFLISPNTVYNKTVCQFNNSDGESITSRIINSNKGEMRYLLNSESSGLYYFQEKNFEKNKRITLAEGQFDIISLFLYNDIFKNSFFIAVSGKKFISTIEKLLFEELLIGEYEINIVFDKDVKNYKRFLYGGKLLAKRFNNIVIKGWTPILKNDTADFPSVTELS